MFLLTVSIAKTGLPTKSKPKTPVKKVVPPTKAATKKPEKKEEPKPKPKPKVETKPPVKPKEDPYFETEEYEVKNFFSIFLCTYRFLSCCLELLM